LRVIVVGIAHLIAVTPLWFLFGVWSSSPAQARRGPNPSIERTSSSQLRCLAAAAHVELQGLPRFVKQL
jgi:hypothetical protein